MTYVHVLALAGAAGPGTAHGIYATGCGNHDVVEELSLGLVKVSCTSVRLSEQKQ